MDFTVPVLYSKELEQDLLGSILINPAVLQDIDLESREFGLDTHKVIYRAMISLLNAGQPIDIATLTDSLTRMGELENIGGVAALAGMINNVSNSLSAEAYAVGIREYARRRQIQLYAGEFARIAYDLDSDIEAKVSELIEIITSGVITGADLKHINDFSRGVLGKIDANRERYIASGGMDTLDGIPTGIVEFDLVFGGGRPGDVFLISGEPGVGKSVFGTQALSYIARIPNHYSALFTLEMSGEQVYTRVLSSSAGVSTAKMRKGDISDEEYEKIISQIEATADVEFYIDDTPSISMSQIRVKANRLKNRMKRSGKVFGALMIDYSLLVEAPGKDEVDRSAYVSKHAKAIAKALGIPVYLIASVTKAGMDGGSVGKANVRGSGQQQHDVDGSLAIMNHIPPRGEKPNPDLVTCLVTKARDSLSTVRVFELRRGNGIPHFSSMSMYSSVTKSNSGDKDEEAF